MGSGSFAKGRRIVLATLVVVTIGGCAEERSKSRVLDVTGTVESVDLANRTVVVSAFVEKLGKEQRFPVRVTDETEILVNGALARLEDVVVGETARGEIRVDVRGNRKQYTALQVRIDRADAIVSPDAKGDDGKPDAKTGD